MTSPARARTRSVPAGQRLVRTLRRRPRLRAGLVHAVYVVAAVAAGLFADEIQSGPRVDADRTTTMLLAIGGGIISLVAVVFSLLFLTVEFASTTLSPRLNTFRDAPLVWHAFGLFVGVFVFVTTAALETSSDETMSVIVPIVAIVLALVAMTVARHLQLSAYRALQVGSTVQDVTRRGRAVIDHLYEPGAAEPVAVPARDFIATTEVRWHGDDGYIRQVDVPRLIDLAVQHDALVELPLRPGIFIRHGDVIFRHNLPAADGLADRLIRRVEIGPDRTWDQDPMLAFRLLVDIGLRAQSPAINDPATSLHMIDAISGLVRYLSDRRLATGDLTDTAGQTRLILYLPTWEDYISAAFDELIDAGRGSRLVAIHLAGVLDDLLKSVPPRRHPELAQRRQELAG